MSKGWRVRPESGSTFRTSETTVSETIVTETSVIWVDSVPLIKAETAKYRAAINKLNIVQKRLDFHTKSDEPAYHQWLHSEFGDQLDTVRELYHKYFELEQVIAAVEDYARSVGASAVEAYEHYLEVKRMSEKIQKAKLEEMEREARARADKESAGEGSAESGEDPFDSSSRSHHAGREAPPLRSKKRSGDDDDEAAIKQIYRTLARKLHPDMNSEVTPYERELWFEVQQAYDDRDLHRLEVLLAVVEREAEEGEGRVEKIQSLSRIKSMLKSLGRKIRNVQRTLSKAKQSVAWDFTNIKSNPRKLSKLRQDVTTELCNAREGIGSEVENYERQIARWERGIKKKNSRGNRGFNSNY